MLDFLIDNIFITFGGSAFQQTIGIHMRTNCTIHMKLTLCFGCSVFFPLIVDHDFLDRGLLLTKKLLNQEFQVVKLKSSLPSVYCFAIQTFFLEQLDVKPYLLYVNLQIESHLHILSLT